MEINKQYGFKQSKLHLTIMDHNLNIIQRLIKENINVELEDNEGETAIFYALECNLAIIKYLVEEGHCNLSHKNVFGMTPLMRLELWIQNKSYSSEEFNTWTIEEIQYHKELLVYLQSRK